MQPGGFDIGHGVISVSADIDKAQIARTVGDAGKKAGQGFTQSLRDYLKKDKSAVTAAETSGNDAAKATGKGFGSKLTAMGPALATAGLAVGAAVGAAIAGAVMSAIDKENVQAQMKAKFGLSPEESKANGAIAGKLYSKGFGDSIADVSEASGLIGKLTGASGKALEDMTKQGLTLQKVFGYDVKESVAAANNIVANGLAPNTTEAFNLIAKGAQMGLDVNDDLIDSLTEYSSQWNKLGVTGPAALGLMSQAQKAGIRNTDLLNDAFKEFSLRAIDGSKGTTAAFKDLGLSTEAIPAALAKGGPEATKALDTVIKKIQGVKDPLKQNEIAVALFGTQFEDMGPKVFNSLDVVAAGATKVGDTTGQMITDLSSTTQARFETIKRTAQQWATNVAGSFLNMAAEGVKNFKAMWNGEGGAGPFSNLTGIIQHVKGLGSTFSTIFNQIKNVILENKTQFQTFFNFILGISKILWSAVGPVFKALGAAIKAVIGILGGLIDFFAGVFTGDWARAGAGIKKIWESLWNGIKGIVTNVAQAIWNIIKGIWNGIKGTVLGFANWFKSGWSTMWTNAKNTIINAGNSIKDGIVSRFNSMKNSLNTAINNVKGFITGMRDHISNMVGSIKGKFDSFKTNTIAAFTAAKDGVKKVWDKLQDVAKKPVNFVIDPVYANIRNLWNNIASKVGLGELPHIAKFAAGGIAPGRGNKDTVPAMLTPGEGILTKDEMRKIGGPKGFAQLRKEIQYFNDGGVVGWIKDKVGGAARGALYKGAKAVADKWVYPFINQMQGGNNFDGLMKAGSRTLIDKALSWIKADDKKHAVPAAGPGIGYQKMMEILRSRFPGLPLISGYRPGSRTLSGNTSYHASGRAVDVKPSEAIAKFIHDSYKNVTKELITPYQKYNLHNGRSHRYTGAIWNQHNYAGGNAHTHWAMDDISQRPPGWFMGYNGTGKTETLVNADKIPDVLKPVNNYVNFNVKMEEIDDVSKLVRIINDLPRALAAGVQGY